MLTPRASVSEWRAACPGDAYKLVDDQEAELARAISDAFELHLA
jgi:hypothetical protein